MANPRAGAHNGALQGNVDSQTSVGLSQAFSRPFTLYEALPYTPFSSIVPIHSGLLPAPSIGSASPAPSLSDIVSSHDFDGLNEEARGSGPLSKQMRYTVGQVQRLIRENHVPEFNFKTGPKSPTPTPSRDKSASLASGLSPISKMVYDQNLVSFRYPTPDTPNSTSPHHESRPKLSAPVPVKKTSPVAQKTEQPKQSSATPKNKQAHARNAAKFEILLPTESQRDQTATLVKSSASPTLTANTASAQTHRASPQAHPQQPAQPPLVSPRNGSADRTTPVTPNQPLAKVQTSSGSQRTTIAVEINASSLNKSEFLVVPYEPDEPITLSARKRKREGFDDDDHYGESLDLRQRADAAFNELKTFLQQVFEAENHVLVTHSGNHAVLLTLDDETTLSSLAQTKAQSLLRKTISLNCYQSVPIDDLLRLTRLCEGAIKQAESLDFKIEGSWGAADVEIWLQQLPNLEMAICAARTSLRTMCGGRADKQLYSEDTIEKCLDLLKRVTDGIVIPIAELRSTGSTADLFKLLCSSKKKVAGVLNDCQKLFSLMATLISKVDTSGTVTNTLEFEATRLIFMETAHTEKDSVIDTQKFDGLRLAAMDMLSQIFLLNPLQRQGIFDEILTSLEKLPLGKRARTFKLIDGNNIQPVSALIMRLIQTSAGKVDDIRGAGRSKAMQSIEGADSDKNGDGPIISFSIRDEEHGAAQNDAAVEELKAVVSPLITTANQNAGYVTQFIVNRALKSTKSGDTPYRNLLDLFVEDFTICLDNPDWPAANLLLWRLTVQMITLLDNEKSAVTAKSTALEVLGIIGGALSKLRGHVRKMAGALDARDADDLGLFLTDLAASALEQKSRPEQMVTWVGPHRATLEYLESRYSEDPHLASAISFVVSTWGNAVCESYDFYHDNVPERDAELGRLAYRLREMIQDRRWLSDQFSFKEVSASQAKLSYGIVLLRSPLYEHFRIILNRLLHSMASDQPTVRSKGLKSINQVLEADSSILDGDSQVIELVVQCANDNSTQVRDSALGLIGKCIAMRPKLEEQMVPIIVSMFSDPGPGVRKRAMKLAKDIYLHNSNRRLRGAIANGLLLRVQDLEESVRDLARQMVEEIWFFPFQGGETSAASQISLSDHVALMVHTIRRGNASNILDKVLQTLLAPQTKTAQTSFDVCKKLVESMFELVDNTDSGDSLNPSGRDVLQVLMIFAKAEAKLFTFEQLQLLKPQMETLRTCDDMAVAKSVVTIYRRVLPQLSSAHQDFLRDIRGILLQVLGKIPRTLLDEVVGCLSIISALLGSKEHVARGACSSLLAIQKARIQFQKTNTMSDLGEKQFNAYALLLGMIGKHFDLENERASFKDRAPPNYSGTVSKLMIDTLLPWTAETIPIEMRKTALDAIGLICQNSPKNYVSASVYTTFQRIFDSQIPGLESYILRSFKEFLLMEEHRSEANPEDAAANGTKKEKKRELTVMGGTNYDEVASATTHRFLKEITRIAMSTEDDHAFLAVEVLASINRQGLVHPKETGVTFITLETSSNHRISDLAFQQHKKMHEKHETVVEREYVKALQSAFAYQRDIVKNSRGATTNPFTPKLHLMMEVLKISKSKNRQRFLDKLCVQVDFDVSKLDAMGDIPPHVEYSRFIIENMAFFEYLTVGEVQAIVSSMEKLATSTGATVAQAIESEVFAVRMDALDSDRDFSAEAQGQISQGGPEVSPKRLRQLTAGSMILLALWEARTYLRRLYSMGTNRRESKAKAQAKDLSKAPVKAQGVAGDKFWDEISNIMTGLTSRERMRETCRAFVELMNVDKEFLVQDDDEDLNGDGPVTPSNEDEDEADEPSAGRGRKRKAVGTTPGGRKKRARSSSQLRKRGRQKKQSAEDLDADGEFDDWA